MKIAILVGDNPYATTSVFAKGLARALTKRGVEATLHYVGEGHFFHALYALIDDPPDCTFSFSDIRGLDWAIPHFTFALDPIVYSLHHKGGILTSVDAHDAQLADVPFLPHAFEPIDHAKKERRFECVFFGSCFDLGTVDEEVVEKGEQVLRTEATLCEVGGERIIEVDRYVRVMDRIRLCAQFPNVMIWGEGPWKKYLPDATVFPALPFEESLALMAQARCVLNSSPRIKNGLHERMLYAQHFGCRLITAQNRFVSGFPQGEWESAPDAVSTVTGEHTWDVRSAQIIDLIQKTTEL